MIAHPGGSFSVDAYPKVAVDSAGDAYFTWNGLDANAKHRVYARRLSAGGTFGPLLTLSGPGVSDSRMAVNGSAAAIFVWAAKVDSSHNDIQARQLTSSGVLGPIKTIGEGVAPEAGGGLGTVNPEAGIDSQGNSYIVWEQPDGHGACGIFGCPKVLGRPLSASGTVGTVPQTLTTTVDGGFSPQIAMTANGNAFVMWKHAGMEGRTRSAAGALGPLQKLTANTGADIPLLKGDATGNTVAVWQNGGVVQARARTAAGALGLLRSFSIGTQPAGGAALGVGSAGNAVIAWGQSDGLGQCFGGSSCGRVGAAVGP